MINLNTSCIILLLNILYTREISSRIFTDKLFFTIMSSMTFNTKLRATVFIYGATYISHRIVYSLKIQFSIIWDIF